MALEGERGRAETGGAGASDPGVVGLHGFGIGTQAVVGTVRHGSAASVLVGSDQPANPTGVDAPATGVNPDVREFVTREELEARLGTELTKAAGELEEVAQGAAPDVAAILEAQAMMAQDPTLIERLLVQLIPEADADHPRNMGAISLDREGLLAAFESVAAELRAVGGYIGERADDIAEIGSRVAVQLFGQVSHHDSVDFDGAIILVLDHLSAAEAAKLDPATLRGVIVATGGATGHAALILRSLGIPALVGCRGASELAEGSMVLLNPVTGEVTATSELTDRDGGTIDPAPPRRRRHGDSRSVLATGAVRLLANVGSLRDSREARDLGADGIGLVRTEFLFEGQAQEPSIDQQVSFYRSILEPFAGSDAPVVFRTLDAGSDKPLPFVELPREDNPALGVRGFRLAAQNPGLLNRQLDALAQARRLVSGVEMWVMAPMISSASEARTFVEMARSVGLPTVGVMVEVPAVALDFARVAPLVNFASIGTNDLMQYLMGADRNGPAFDQLLDPWNPVGLRVIESVARSGARAKVEISVCGEAASDPLLAAVLVGLGVTGLSMTPVALAGVREVLEGLSMTRARRLARHTLTQEDGPTARRTVVEARL
ncbi:putative PEP-binding protein [Ferrimicrobium sp.]|uniref:putative PEP-binding protein n=1 Tax=Ferrimicrobium sp. TaxID=2926050 RepID=UPI0026169315|nr:putative PEP-binding protein [Ferrimicrobium sp.]